MKNFKTIAAAVLLGSVAWPAAAQSIQQVPLTSEQHLQCAAWAANLSYISQGEEKFIYAGLMQWFLGLYEGASGQGFEQPFAQLATSVTEADMNSYEQFCRPAAAEFGDRLTAFGEATSG